MNIKYSIIALCAASVTGWLIANNDKTVSNAQVVKKNVTTPAPIHANISDSPPVKTEVVQGTPEPEDLASHARDLDSSTPQQTGELDTTIEAAPDVSTEDVESEIALQYEFDFYEEQGEDPDAWQTYSNYFSATALEGLSMANLECHQFTCRVEFSLDVPGASEALLSHLGVGPLDKGGAFYLSEDQTRIVIFAKHRIDESGS